MSSSSPAKRRRRIWHWLIFPALYVPSIVFFPAPLMAAQPTLLYSMCFFWVALCAVFHRFLFTLLLQFIGVVSVVAVHAMGIDYVHFAVSQVLALGFGSLLIFWRSERDAAEERLESALRLVKNLEGDKLPEVERMLATNRVAYYEELTILFSDIRNFSALAETLPADRLYGVLNQYYDGIVRIVTEHGGIIDKFLGDGIMVVFGLTQKKKNAAEQAVRCALRMLDYQKQAADLPGAYTLRAGLGIATGRVMVGLVGGAERFDWTCLGDPVNLAARLERMTRELPCEILISETTWLAIRDIPDLLTRTAAFTRVRGRFSEEAVIEVVPARDSAYAEKLTYSREALEKALKMRRHGYAEQASRILQELAAANPEDKLIQHYLTSAS